MSNSFGFSLWADFIERDFLAGDFKAMIAAGSVNGATSNPAIFKQAFTTSEAYKEQKAAMAGAPVKTIYEALAIEDIKEAATILEPLYTKGNDGYVSIEVDPFLCDDAEATITEGKRLHAAIGKPNVMIKVPATEAGFTAMEALTAEGIAVNATLIFSLDQALNCAKAFERGRQKGGKTVDTVISVFVSRFDRMLDSKLEAAGIKAGLVGIYNAANIYNEVEALHIDGVRVLFASTGVKGDAYPPSYYVDELLAAHSVNTAPIGTIEAFLKQGSELKPKLPIDATVIADYFAQVRDAGINMDLVCKQLMDEGLEAFKEAFDAILITLK